MSIVPVILCGGKGRRLWPASSNRTPKPFLDCGDGENLFFKTLARAHKIPGVSRLVIVTGSSWLYYVRREISKLKDLNDIVVDVIVEPVPRNSLNAILSAAIYLADQHNSNAGMLVMPSDHSIKENDEFFKGIDQAQRLTNEEETLVTFGVTPDRPHTGYGYIKASGTRVEKFVEKPNLKNAKLMLDAGDHFWNSGIFLFRVGCFLTQAEKHASEACHRVRCAYEKAQRQGSFERGKSIYLDCDEFTGTPDISVDYAILEKSKSVSIVPLDMGWSDVGTWVDFANMLNVDEFSNSTSGDVHLQCAIRNTVYGNLKPISLFGVSDLLISDSLDHLLIASKANVSEFDDFLLRRYDGTGNKDNDEKFGRRPWGFYESLTSGDGFKVKRIVVNPGQRLSLQSHVHRSELWSVVSGVASVEINGIQSSLSIRQSCFIEAGRKHRLSNNTEEMLSIIEIQFGDYLGEDDIIRYEDIYGRA
jgi:mannose-1-phosphate guanylyltransferase/mannose-6-phosphate isomerase